MIPLQSKQGPRQGCSAGTEAFCFTIHPLLTTLKTHYPEFEFRVLTDDIIPICPPPSDPTPAAWQALYVRYASLLTELQSLAAQINLKLNPGKGALLLPAQAPLPNTATLTLFPPSFTFTHSGIVVAGSPIGTTPTPPPSFRLSSSTT